MTFCKIEFIDKNTGKKITKEFGKPITNLINTDDAGECIGAILATCEIQYPNLIPDTIYINNHQNVDEDQE